MSNTPNTPNTPASDLRPVFDGYGYGYLVDAHGYGGGEHDPRILRCETDYKVSPHGDADPDRDSYWVDTVVEALEDLRQLHAASAERERLDIPR